MSLRAVRVAGEDSDGAGVEITPATIGRVLMQEIRHIQEHQAAGTGERARILAQLCGVALRVFEAGDLAGRLEEIEQRLAVQGPGRGGFR